MVVRKRKGGKKATKKGWKRKPTVTRNKALTPFPQRFITTMKYSAPFELNALNSWTYRFNLNSIFDPDRTGVGNQPYGHDTCETIYNRYRVISCSYVITAYNGTTAIRVGAIPANEQMTIASLSDAIMNPRAKFIIQYPGGNTNKLMGKTYMPSLVGRNKAQYMADDRYQAQFGFSPVELAILNIFGGGLNDSGQTVNGTITLHYKVECFDIKQLPLS